MAWFKGNEIKPGERASAVKSLAGIALNFIQSADHPTTASDYETACAVAEVTQLFSTLGTGYFSHSGMDRFHDLWFKFAREDHVTGGAFGSERFGMEVIRRANYLASRGKDDEVLGWFERDAELHANLDASTRLGLRGMAGDIHRVAARFGEALAQLEAARELSLTLAPRDQFRVQGLIAKLECDLGRLDEASAALAEMAGLISKSAPENRPILRAQLAESRILWQLAKGQNKSVARIAAQATRALAASKVEADHHFDRLHMYEFLADARMRTAKGAIDGENADAIATADELLGSPHLGPRHKFIIELEKIALFSRSGHVDEAAEELAMLTERVRDEVTQSPLFGCRFAVRRFELARKGTDPEERVHASDGMIAAFARLIQSWQQTDLRASGVGFLGYGERRRAFDMALQATLEKALKSPDKGIRRALELTLFVEEQSTIAKKLDAHGTTASDVSDFSKATGTTIIQLVPTPDATHRFVISGGRVTHDVLEGEGEFTARFETLLSAIRKRPGANAVWPDATTDRAIRWLSKRLVPNGKKVGPLCYSGLSSLGLAPVEALHDQDGNPIGLSRVVFRAPAIVSLVALGESFGAMAKGHGEGLRLFALSGEVGGRAALDMTLAEDSKLRAASGNRLQTTQGAGATRKGFRESLSSGAAVFVAWTHGAAAETGSRTPGLVVKERTGPTPDSAAALVESSTLSPSSLDRTFSKATARAKPIVSILAVCNAKDGPRRVGDAGSSDFSGAFLGGGVPAVISSPERLDRNSAMQFLLGFSAAFYGKEGATAGEATLAARRHVAATPGMNHPHFWAPLQLAGWARARLLK